MRLSSVASVAGATVHRDGEFASLGFVTNARDQMLVFAESSDYVAAAVANTKVSAIVTTSELAPLAGELGILTASDPRLAFYEIHNHLADATDFYRQSFATSIHPSARIHPTAVISPRDVIIDADVEIHAFVTVYAFVAIERGCTIRAGTVLGSEGFQSFIRNGRPVPIRHGGSVRICEGADVHSNTCVDRSLFGGETTIGPWSRVDNLVHIAHDAIVGRACRIAAGSTLCGSAILGDEVWLGPHCTVSSEVKVGDGALVSIGSVVTRNVPPNIRVSGNFALPHDKFLDHMRSIR